MGHLNDHCGKRLDLRPPQPHQSPADDLTGIDAATAAAVASLPFEGASGRRQTVLVSATLTPSVLSRSAKWCPSPRFVSAGAVPAIVPGISDGDGGMVALMSGVASATAGASAGAGPAAAGAVPGGADGAADATVSGLLQGMGQRGHVMDLTDCVPDIYFWNRGDNAYTFPKLCA